MSPSLECPICSRGTVATRFRFGAYDVARCAHCTAEWLHPQPDDAVLASIYTEDYFFGRRDEADQKQHAALKQASALRTLSLLPPPQAGARLLDIGAGTGDFLVVAARLGYDVAGVEFSASSAATAQSRVAGTIFQGELAGAAFPDNAFDVVANSDVIEHTRDPRAFVREMRRILKPGGTAVVSTPSTDSWSARIMGRRWMEYKVEHLFYFDRQSLDQVLRDGGFTSIVIRPNVKVLSVGYIAAHFEKFPVPGWSQLVAAASAPLPGRYRDAPFPIVASGITAIAR